MPRFPLLILLVLLSGCYRYCPQRPGAVPPGSDVRVHLSVEGVQRIGEAYGSAYGMLDGRLESWADEVVLTVAVPAAPGMIDRGLRNRIVIPQPDIVGIDLRQLDRTRTGALSATLGVVVVGAAIALFTGTFGGGTATDPPAPEDTIIPNWLQIFE